MKDFICNLTINQWLVITPIILSMVSIIIAIWSSYSTSKMARKQINALKDVALLQIGSSQCDLAIEGVKAAITERKLRNELSKIKKEIQTKRQEKDLARVKVLQEEYKNIEDNILCIKGLQGHIMQMSAKCNSDRNIVNRGR